MTNDTLNDVSKPMQEGCEDLLARIALLDAELIALKLDVRERLTHKETISTSRETEQAREETEEQEDELTYAFTKDEILAINILFDNSMELLTTMQGVTAEIAGKISMDEHRYILTLQNNIARIFSNYNYHFPSIKQFEEWIKERTLQ